jgi:hypothetical protein
MHKHLLTLSLFFSTFSLATAQTTPSASATIARTNPTLVTSADTVQAIHRLFSKHRTGGWLWTGIGAAFATRILVTSATEGFANAGGTVVVTAVLGGIPAGIGIGKLSRFNEDTESQVVAMYQKSKLLPNNIKRRLKRKYFAG